LTATDVGVLGAVGGGLFSDPIRGSSATSGRASISHSFTPKLVGSINGLYQAGTFIGGGPTVDGQGDSYASGDVTLSYRITQNISTRVSYAHDRVDSDLVNDLREFTRNRVFLGVNFTY
jgi:predicted porin